MESVRADDSHDLLDLRMKDSKLNEMSQSRVMHVI